MTLNIPFVGQVGNLQRVGNPLLRRRLTILPHAETHDL